MNLVSRLMPFVALFCVACSNNNGGGGGAGAPLVVTHDVEGSHFVSLPIHSHYAVIYEDGVHQLGNEEDDNIGGEIVLGSQGPANSQLVVEMLHPEQHQIEQDQTANGVTFTMVPFDDGQTLDLSNRYTDPDYEPAADAGSGSGFVTTFVCPSGGDDPARYEFSYAASQGSLPRNAVYDDKSAVFAVANGVADTHFRRGGKVTMQSVYDGASNTVFYAERRPIQAGERSWTADVVGLTAMRLATAANAATDFEIAENHKRRRFDDVHNSDYMHIVGPNGRACWFRNANGNYTAPALSYHTGGMNVSRVDGSVSFVSDEIDTKVWQDLGSRDQRIEQPLLKLWDGK